MKVSEAEHPPLSANLAELLAAISARNPLHKPYLDRSIAFLIADELARFESVLGYLLGLGLDLAYVADSYLTVVEDTTAEQMHFFRHGEYRNKSYEDVASSVYNDRFYMDRYMYGLVLTAFLWPNHVRIARFFEEVLPLGRAGRYLEVGPGHGYFMATCASRSSFDELLGIDISKASIAQTRSLIAHFAPQSAARCELRCADFLAADNLAPESFDAAVMGEVIEHVEDPAAFLRRLHGLVREDAFIYLTSCVNTPAIDHIYLWRSTDSLEAMIADCGFGILKALRLPYEGRTLEQARKQGLPISVAYVLKKIPE